MADVRQGRAWQALREEVFNRDGRQCAECGHEGSEDNPLQIDHVIAINQGGAGRDLDNLQVLCRKHNLLKSDNVTPKRSNWWDRTWLDDIA